MRARGERRDFARLSPKMQPLVAAVMLLLLSGCDPDLFGPAPVDAGAKPNASALARPVVTTIALTPDGGVDAGAKMARDGGVPEAGVTPPPPPEPFRADEALLLEATRQKDVNGISLLGRWLLHDLADTPSGVPHDAEADSVLRAALGRRWEVQMTTAGRMRIDFESRGTPLLQGSALLARRSRYGHVLMWPHPRGYRVMPPGTLRTAFSELRADVTPLLSPALQPLPDGKRLELTTRKLQLRTGYGQLVLEQAEVGEAGEGAALFCRTLLELAGIAPSAEVCVPRMVCVSAEYHWGGAFEGPAVLRFEATELRRQLVQGAAPFVMVPAGLRRRSSGLPEDPLPLKASELRDLRSEEPEDPSEPAEGAPSSGVTAYNGSDHLMWLYLDGVGVAAVAPWQTVAVPELKRGRYAVQWRSYLGDVIGERSEITLPAKVGFGAAPASEQADAGT